MIAIFPFGRWSLVFCYCPKMSYVLSFVSMNKFCTMKASVSVVGVRRLDKGLSVDSGWTVSGKVTSVTRKMESMEQCVRFVFISARLDMFVRLICFCSTNKRIIWLNPWIPKVLYNYVWNVSMIGLQQRIALLVVHLTTGHWPNLAVSLRALGEWLGARF